MQTFLLNNLTSTENDKLTTTILILAIIAFFVLLIVLFYMIIAFRRFSIVSKKADYLIEDITYKSEMIMPSIEAINKLAKYANLLDLYLANNPDYVDNLTKNNDGKKTKKSLASDFKKFLAKEAEKTQ